MKERIALLDWPEAMGCKVRRFETHAIITFPADSLYLDLLRETIWKFMRLTPGMKWYSETRTEGELTWS